MGLFYVIVWPEVYFHLGLFYAKKSYLRFVG